MLTNSSSLKTCTHEEYLAARRIYCLKTFRKEDASNIILNQKSHLIGLEKVLDEMKRLTNNNF